MRLWRLRRLSFIPSISTICKRWEYMKLCYNSLTFNVYGDYFDVCFEPIMCIVDFATGIFGVVFVTLVVALISAVVIIYYMDVIPYLYVSRNYYYASLVVLYGHYLLLLISFHYYKAVRTIPGKPPSDMSERTVTTVCKRCILPKPPRTHHCSVCKTCVLKMDHHCPWVNNCVGHYNHRYFMLFCIFMWLGTVYVSTTSWPIFYDCFDVASKTRYTSDTLYGLVGYNNTKISVRPSFEELLQRRKSDNCVGKSSSFKTRIIFLWLLCSAVTFSLGILTSMHLKLVSTGQTTIEQLINKKEKNRMRKKGLIYVNPYHYGVLNNWQKLLGFNNTRTLIKYVLLPIPRHPEGNGLEWQTSKNL